MTRSRDVANIDGLLTTTGDTFYASAAATPARLGIGSTGQVMTVAGGVPSWATAAAGGSLTLLSTTSLSGLPTSGPNITGISGSYTNLLIVIVDAYTSGDHNIQFGWNTQATTYVTTFGSNGNGQTSSSSGTGTLCRPAGTSIIGATSPYFSATINISRYATTDVTKPFSFAGGFYNANFGGVSAFSGGGRHINSSAITSFTFRSVDQTGNWNGGTIYIYGVN